MKFPKPSKILCVGLNYRSHAEETGGEVPKEPVIFSKFTDALAENGQAIPLPDWHRCYDYEAELVIVMGKALYHGDEAAAWEAIGGYTCGNDLSARDCQFRSNQWLLGKALPAFAPIGPTIVPAAEFDPRKPHRITCKVNDNVVQDDDVTNMLFDCGTIVSYISEFMPLQAGDLIFTGTPAGVILGRPKGQRNWLKPGDTVTVTIEGIGTLENTMTAYHM